MPLTHIPLPTFKFFISNNRFESCLACLWSLFYDKENAITAKESNVILTLVAVLQSGAEGITENAKNVSLKALWLLSNITNSSEELVKLDMIPETLRLSMNAEAPPMLRHTACQFLVSIRRFIAFLIDLFIFNMYSYIYYSVI